MLYVYKHHLQLSVQSYNWINVNDGIWYSFLVSVEIIID